MERLLINYRFIFKLNYSYLTHSNKRVLRKISEVFNQDFIHVTSMCLVMSEGTVSFPSDHHLYHSEESLHTLTYQSLIASQWKLYKSSEFFRPLHSAFGMGIILDIFMRLFN